MKLISFYEHAQRHAGKLWLQPHTNKKTIEVVNWINNVKDSTIKAEHDTMITGFNPDDNISIIKLIYENGYQSLHSIKDMVFQFNYNDSTKPKIIRYDCNKEINRNYGPTYYEQINDDTFIVFHHKFTHNLFKIENKENFDELIQFLNTKNNGQYLSDKIKDGMFSHLFNDDYFVLQNDQQINCCKLPIYIELEYFYNDNSIGDLKIHDYKALDQLKYKQYNEIKSKDYIDRLLKPDEESLEKYKVININKDTIEFNSNLSLISDDFNTKLNVLIFNKQLNKIRDKHLIKIEYNNDAKVIYEIETLCRKYDIKLNFADDVKEKEYLPHNITPFEKAGQLLHHSLLFTMYDTISQREVNQMSENDVLQQYKYLIHHYLQNLDVLNRLYDCSNKDLIKLTGQFVSILQEPIEKDLINIGNKEIKLNIIKEINTLIEYIEELQFKNTLY